MPQPQPIVFFPGVMGSRLYFETSGMYWDPDSTWRMLRWAPLWPFRSDDDNRRDLHAREPAGVLMDPLTSVVDDDGVAHGWGGVVWSFYSDYLSDLRNLAAGGQAFAVGYDWRQDIQWLGEYAADKLLACLDQTGADKLWLVTHSMGGLVVRAAFRFKPDLMARVEKVLHVCQPTTGAVVLYRRMFTGLVPGLDGGGSLSERAFRLLLGNSRIGFVGNMSGQPGPMQLMPSAFFPVEDGGQRWNQALDTGTAFGDLFDNAASPPGVNDVDLALSADVRADLLERVRDVADFQNWLGEPRISNPPAPETWLIYGTERNTETRIEFAGSVPTPVVTAGGDGTVPAVSATALGLVADRQHPVPGLEHSTACRNQQVRDFTAQLFGT
jgi:pimeloyl-ACP methyl ester carboxylesterase